MEARTRWRIGCVLAGRTDAGRGEVFSPLDAPRESASVRLALHAHFYYVLHAGDLAARLAGNVTRCDLFLSTDTNTKAAHLRTAFAGHARHG